MKKNCNVCKRGPYKKRQPKSRLSLWAVRTLYVLLLTLVSLILGALLAAKYPTTVTTTVTITKEVPIVKAVEVVKEVVRTAEVTNQVIVGAPDTGVGSE